MADLVVQESRIKRKNHVRELKKRIRIMMLAVIIASFCLGLIVGGIVIATVSINELKRLRLELKVLKG